MEVVVIESEAFKRLEQMFIESQEIIKVQALALLKSKIGLLDAKQVSELTGYHEKTILTKKAEIGYSSMGRDIKFRLEDVNNWINKYYRAPRQRSYS